MEEFIKNRVWIEKGKMNSVKELGFDAYGDIILFADYENDKSPYGWVIAHIACPKEVGENLFENLQPLNVKNEHKIKCPCAVSFEQMKYKGKDLQEIFKTYKIESLRKAQATFLE
jgi:hypothetical protein